jgi:hypothetical protein
MVRIFIWAVLKLKEVLKLRSEEEVEVLKFGSLGVVQLKE